MAAGAALGSGDGGGARISTLRPPAARLTAIAAPLLVALALATYPLSAASDVPLAPILLAALALLLLGAGLVLQRPVVLPLVLLTLAAEYLTAQAVQWPAIDSATPLYAGGLLVVAEVSSWSLESHRPSRTDPDLGRRRAFHLAVIVLGAIALDEALLWVAAIPVASNLLLTGVGVVAAIACLAVLALLARRG